MKNHGIRKRCIHARDSLSQGGLFLGPEGQGILVYTPDNNQAQQQQPQSPIQYTNSASSELASSSFSALSQSVSSSAPITSVSPSSTWSTVPPTSTTSVDTSSLLNLTSSGSSNDTTSTLASTSATTTTTLSTSTSESIFSSPTSGSNLSATQPIAVAVPSSTAAVSSSPSTADPSQAESKVPIYVGIVLGIIVVIAFLAALVAWSVRLHRHRKRSRNTLTNVPWANLRDDEFPSKLESGTSTPDDVSFNRLHTWEPRGDRDVGEPKRSESYFFAKAPVIAARPIYATPVPPPQLPPLPHVMPLQDSMVYSLPQHPTVAHTLPMMVNYGTPRQAVERPRYLSLGEDGMGLAVPWRHTPPPPPLTVRTPPPPPSIPVQPAPPAPLPCPFPTESRIRRHHREFKEREQEEEKEEQEGWTTSVRSSLVSAFNAVAASLPNGHHLSLANGEADNLTAVPKRRLEREMSNASATSSTTLEGYRGFDHAFSPLPEDTNLKIEGSELGMTSAPLAPERYRRHSRRKGEGVVSRSSTLTSASSVPWRKKSVLSYSGSVRSRFSTMSELSDSEEFARKLLCARLMAS